MFNYNCHAYTAGCPTDANDVVLVERRNGSTSLHYAGCFCWFAAEPWENSEHEIIAWRRVGLFHTLI